MSFEKVKKYFDVVNLSDRVIVLEQSSATVQLAAEAIGCEAKQIAKSISFLLDDNKPILVVAAGNVKIDNKKFKNTFNQKSKMIPRELVKEYIGHDAGGVCPFVIKPEVTVYLDESLKQSDVLYPAAGSDNSVVKLSLEELERFSDFKEWVDVCKE